MLRIERHVSAPHGLAPGLLARARVLSLPFGERSKSRLRTSLTDGEEVALFLARGTVLRGGDLLIAENGTMIRVAASPEEVLEVRSGNVHDLIRAAYHLGNRHIRVELGPDYLRLEHDPVLGSMLEGLGLLVHRELLPFEPETGAYGGGHRHGHDETFPEDYALAQASFQLHAAASAGQVRYAAAAGNKPQQRHVHQASAGHGQHDQCRHGHDHGHEPVHEHSLQSPQQPEDELTGRAIESTRGDAAQ